MSTPLNIKLTDLKVSMNETVMERASEIHTAVLALLARRHHFQMGPPGTAKSYLVSELVSRIAGLDNSDYFRWLLTKYTQPEELFGGPNFSLLREHGVYKRVTDRKLPVAKIAFLDEIFKGSSAILNTMLTAMNERQFYNLDDAPEIPLITVFAASNEMPEGDELWALWDRLHFRHTVDGIKETSNFIRLLHGTTVKVDPIVSINDIYEAQQIVSRIPFSQEIERALVDLRHNLRDVGVSPSDRRWRECVSIIQAEAFMNGHPEAKILDLRPLMHVLWTDPGEIRPVTGIVLEIAHPIDKQFREVLDDLEEIEVQFDRALRDSDNALERSQATVQLIDKTKRINVRRLKASEEARNAEYASEYLETAKTEMERITQRLVVEGLQVDISETK